MDDYNKTLGLHDLKEGLKKSYGKQLIENLKLDWIFNKWYEKLIIFVMLVWSIYSIGRLIF
jgi:hypothetical protein